MDYEKIYNKIIDRAKSENREYGNGVYYEKHHIKPQSLFKELKKDPNNIVLLTAKEHFICHMLLAEIYDCREMKYAIWRMCNDSTYKVSAKYYEFVKNLIAQESSRLNKGRKLSQETREKISKANKGRVHSAETKEKMRNSYDPKKHILTEEQRKMLSENARNRFTGVKKTDDFKKHLSEIRSGSGNTMYGKCNKDFMTEEKYAEYRKHLSESLRGRSYSEETRKKIGEKTKERVQGGDNPRAVQVRIVELNKTFSTIQECAEYIGVNRNTLRRNKVGNISTVKNYTIEYIEKLINVGE